MPRIMYDSTNPFDIPEHAQMVLVYMDGKYAWSQAGKDRFKYAVQVTCSAIGAVVAQIGDVELGCIWPVENAVPYVRRQRAAGLVGCIYINQANDWGPCREAFRGAGEPEPLWLVANYDGNPFIPAGAIGKQYAHPSKPLGNPLNKPWHTAGHWDESIVADYWPGVDGDEMDWETFKSFMERYEKFHGRFGGPEAVGSNGPSRRETFEILRQHAQKEDISVTMTEEDKDDIAAKIKLGLLEELAPLFELARRLEN